MTSTSLTPNSHSRQHTSFQINTNLNQRKHSVRTQDRSTLVVGGVPDAPVFLEEPLFLQGFDQSKPTTATQPERQTTTTGTGTKGGLFDRVVMKEKSVNVERGVGGQDGNQQNNAKKRTAAETMIDLTNTTTTNSPEQDQDNGGTNGRQVKKVKTSATAISTATTTTTTTTTDGSKKRSKRGNDRAEKHEKLAQESARWRAKYKQAFPSFTFYFDALDEGTKAQLGVQVKKLGASVDQFFSKKVTHVVTSRSLPSQSTNKENVDSPVVSSSKVGGQFDSAVGKAKKVSTSTTARSPKSYSLLNGQKLRPTSGDLDKNPFIDAQDILSKAIDFKLKIWHLDKLQLILARINSHSPNKQNTSIQRDPSLPSLLRDEQLFGTRERDPFVPRNDMHYFGSNKYYLLVEDSTGEHRPIVIQEYDKPRKHEDTTWPILYGGIEGRTGFYKHEGPIVYHRQVPPPNPPPRVSNAGEGKKLMAGFSTTAARAVGAPNLRRAISLQNVPRAGTSKNSVNMTFHDDHDQVENKHAAPGGIHRRDSYIAASGNSQIITSNTGTSTRSGAAMQPGGGGGGKGAMVDKRLAVLATRTVSMSMARGGGSTSTTMSKKEIKVSSKAKRGGMQRSYSVDGTRFANLATQVREEPKKPGYCENCRIKYEDFKTHVVSSKHRRFALNDKNWIDLDDLLTKIARRTAPIDSVMSPSVASSSPGGMDDSGYCEAFLHGKGFSDDEDDEAERNAHDDDDIDEEEEEDEEDEMEDEN